MNIPYSIVSKQPFMVQELFNYWGNYLNENIHFLFSDSKLHSKSHSERVLMNALLIGHRIFGDASNELTCLAHAAIFHDSCRWDDCLDVGHGARAAEYYASYCKERELELSKEAYYCMKYHDRDDVEGITSINNNFEDSANHTILLYQIFKDADALDRYRFGTHGVDKSFIRNRESIDLMDTALELVKNTIPNFDAQHTDSDCEE